MFTDRPTAPTEDLAGRALFLREAVTLLTPSHPEAAAALAPLAERHEVLAAHADGRLL